MTDSSILRDQYANLVQQIIQDTLQGKIRAKEQVGETLKQQVAPGTGEIFERCLSDQLAVENRRKEIETDELGLAKVMRRLRALNTIDSEWKRIQEQHQASDAVNQQVQSLATAPDSELLSSLLATLDPSEVNGPQSRKQLRQLAKNLKAVQTSWPEVRQAELQDLAVGIERGLQTWARLEDCLVSWVYDQDQAIGFESTPGSKGPWQLWSKQVTSPFVQTLFKTLATGEAGTTVAQARGHELDLAGWAELAVLLVYLEQGLVAWFDQLVYDSRVGSRLSVSTFLMFAVLWSQLADGFARANLLPLSRRSQFVNGSFRASLQTLRTFAGRDYFPLYGGLFASFTGAALRDALTYLDEPLKQSEGNREKGRILNLLGFSARAQGQYERSHDLHQQSLSLATSVGDFACQIANLNHLSRLALSRQEYGSAIQSSQRALVLSRQYGDRPGEANALANLGYAEVLNARFLERSEPETLESAIAYLQQGLKITERLGDRQIQAICLSSLGLAQLALEDPQAALAYLEGGMQAAQFAGDLYLYSLNLANLGEAYYRLEQPEKAIRYASLGMYLLEQAGSRDWRQPAGLLTVLEGKLGMDQFQALLAQNQPQIQAVIGPEGYEHLSVLLAQYQE
ncbi:tetratricopeptide repeat protein [Leptolyngbya sp. FACHB-261]|uniref:tetratricopeptide repeat protein n=1 Tax=Leptolyngbya sp. FACHB-261 TaxID=2692806 RepID=UPI001682BDBB|nr:tetratricopeptide repeat protein [Leptolyngbya sp. FACHB-261]MBD2105256.1 tetratricopeptide repeat protein [Leptolyngbya sp. FACHB-261]